MDEIWNSDIPFLAQKARIGNFESYRASFFAWKQSFSPSKLSLDFSTGMPLSSVKAKKFYNNGPRPTTTARKQQLVVSRKWRHKSVPRLCPSLRILIGNSEKHFCRKKIPFEYQKARLFFQHDKLFGKQIKYSLLNKIKWKNVSNGEIVIS